MSDPVSLVLFGLGDGVCSFVFERRMAEYRQLSGLDESEILERLWKPGYSKTATAAPTTWMGCTSSSAAASA